MDPLLQVLSGISVLADGIIVVAIFGFGGADGIGCTAVRSCESG